MGTTLLAYNNQVVQGPVPTVAARSQSSSAPASRLLVWWPQLYWEQRGYSLANQTSGLVTVPNSSSLQITGNLTLEAWAFLGSFAADGGLEVALIMKHTAAEYALIISASGVLAFLHGNGTTAERLNGPTLQLYQWYHVAVVRDAAAKTVKFYVNGQLQTTASYTTTTVATSTQAVRLMGNTTTAGRMNGRMTEVRIWNVAKTDAQVFNDYAAAYTTATGLVANWRFDEGSGTTLADSSGNGNNGTITSLTWNNERPEWLTLTWPQAVTGNNWFAMMGPGLQNTDTVLLDKRPTASGDWSRVGQLSASEGLWYLNTGSTTHDGVSFRFVLLPNPWLAQPRQVGLLWVGMAQAMSSAPLLPLRVEPVDTSQLAVSPWLAMPYGVVRRTALAVEFAWVLGQADVNTFLNVWRSAKRGFPVYVVINTPPKPQTGLDGLYVFAEPPNIEQIGPAAYRVRARMVRVWPQESVGL